MLRRRREAWCAVVAALALAMIGPSASAVQPPPVAPPTPWDGTNPFNCTIQDAGRGTTVPDPGADPYCVSFDKTNQNVTQLGIVDFLLNEPARVAAAVPKCFYFQEDHWRGSLIQSAPQTVLYEFYGHYFFNKATGDGGAYVTGFQIAGQTVDPTALPGFPPGYGQYFGPGTGGVITHDNIPADPRCAALANSNPAAVYAAAASVPRCVSARWRLSRSGIGPLRLGMSEDRVRALLGPPSAVKRGFLSYCVSGGGQLLIGEPGDRSGTYGSGGRSRAVMLLSSSPQVWLRGWRGRIVSAGSRSRVLGRGSSRWRLLTRTPHGSWVRRGNRVAELFPRGRITYLGVYARRAVRSLGALRGYLRRAG